MFIRYFLIYVGIFRKSEYEILEDKTIQLYLLQNANKIALEFHLNGDEHTTNRMLKIYELFEAAGWKTIITDRTIIDVMAFTRLAKSIPYFMADALNDAVSHLIREYDYIFYVSPKGVELEDNGVRTIDIKYRNEIDKEIQSLILRHKPKFRNYTILSGTTEERIEKIKQVIGL